MFFLSFPLPTITFPACHHISCIFTIFLAIPSHFLHFHGTVPAFSHIFPLASCPYHHISCVVTIFLRFLWRHPAIFSHQNNRPRYFPAFFLAFSRVFPLISPTCHHISCIFTVFSRYSITFPAFSQHFLAIFLHFPPFAAIFLHVSIFCPFFLSFPLHTIIFPAFSQYFRRFLWRHPAIFSHQNNSPRCFLTFFRALSHVFPLVSSANHHISCIFTIFSRYPITFPAFSRHFLAIFLHFPKLFPPFAAIFLHVPIFCPFFPYFLHFHNIFYGFYDIILQYSAAKIADLGGIDTPPSANCLAVHNPAKLSRWAPYSQPESEILSHFVNHSPPYPLFSLRSQTATSQLAGFRKNLNLQAKVFVYTYFP